MVDIESAPGLKTGTNTKSSKQKPEIEEILFNKRLAPLGRSDFEQFLKNEFSEENLEFWLEAQQFKEEVEGKQTGESPVVVRDAMSKNPSKIQLEIVDKYVVIGSEKEINIEGNERKKIIKNKPESEVLQYTPNLFDKAQDEIKLLMARDSFVRYLEKFAKTNISKEEVDSRFRVGFSWLLFGVILFVLLFTLTEEKHWRLFCVLPFWISFAFLSSASRKV